MSFYVVFYTVLGLTCLSGLGAVVIAFLGDKPLTPAQGKLFDALVWILVSGVMLFLILLGAYLGFKPISMITDLSWSKKYSPPVSEITALMTPLLNKTWALA